ncbi:hypothetical protein NDU88_010188 [Pleurodeles waltl]|uniref:Uncharacterized protein n=1 Tax=Pleurodeles waltl TaxID=8319 RepID=A0AAV7RXE9_PLEWA|nr:hypothetical protein NDU88_010188 [Pleurodeles waltl]
MTPCVRTNMQQPKIKETRQSERCGLGPPWPILKKWVPRSTRAHSPEGSIDADSAPVTKGFLTSLFDSLKGDLQSLRKDISQELRELCTELTLLGESVSGSEENETAREEDVELLRQEVLRLHEQQDTLQARVKVLENRSCYNNIRIMGVPSGAEGWDFKEYTLVLFCFILD